MAGGLLCHFEGLCNGVLCHFGVWCRRCDRVLFLCLVSFVWSCVILGFGPYGLLGPYLATARASEEPRPGPELRSLKPCLREYGHKASPTTQTHRPTSKTHRPAPTASRRIPKHQVNSKNRSAMDKPTQTRLLLLT